MSTKALHLEIVTDLTSNNLIDFKRFLFITFPSNFYFYSYTYRNVKIVMHFQKNNDVFT